MRSAANSALRNNRSFVPLCRADRGCIGQQVDGSSVIKIFTGST